MSSSAMIGPVAAPELHAMTYNIRRRMTHLGRRSPDRWSRRKWLLRRLLTDERPTVMCVQEALPDQARWVLDSLGPDYRTVGRGRDADGGGEGTPIFFDSRRLRLVGWDQLALSDSPRTPGSRGWGNLVPRIVVSARFVDRETETGLHVVNTHLDHLSPRSRLRSAGMLRQLIEQRPEPALLTCDANTGVGSRPFRALTEGGLLRDAWTAAERRLTQPWGTFSNYRRPKRDGRRIDWILVSAPIEVRAVAINAMRFDGAAASDHEPMQARLAIPR
ncbi:Metal-dependent hydrolase, endonuclease/exonuclease/phosphatase family [Agrococcus baldri]|uniref:Metal-dependent hydrolase, endonuclease/exonuclease/phosphatase family n=1 Tax=Agrococcus baldri TaxID=153730 RepID=A0AA94L088_9MICO|nr:endonuclease/exonuclease/phosphatase family protein [Agrococcus baldri]SFS15885.1 Metal-dependent hydrolase, endonuclease/exonuclease/phosphatase family [Agrococcus baldri]